MKNTYKIVVRKTGGKKPLQRARYERKDNNKMVLILFMVHSIMLQITQTSRGFTRNGSWPNLRYCLIILTL
jgi:hypothetical protein